MSTLRVICYDIPRDRTRNRVAQLLEGYGERVQASVFECWLEPATLQQLQRRLRLLIDPETDKIGIYSLCGRDRDDRQHHGQPGPTQDSFSTLV